ncbi:amino acid permease [Thermodesulfobacteriota bacterium]
MNEELGLERRAGLSTATTLVIANMIGTGVFTTSGFIMQELHSPVIMLLCWFVGGLFALAGALCYAELGAMFPKAGGEYIYLRESFGKPIAFLSGWISLIVGFSAPIAAGALAFSAYFLTSVPLFPGADCSASLFPVPGLCISIQALIAVVVIIVFSFVHIQGLALGSLVQNLLTGFKIVLICIFVFAGLNLGSGSFAHFGSGFRVENIFTGSFAVSLIYISFAYSGWNAAAYLGGEIKRPARNLPLSLIVGTSAVVVLYLLLNITFIYALPPDKMAGTVEVGAQSARALFGTRAGRAFSSAIALCLLSVISAMIMAGPRVYYAMAQDRIFLPIVGSIDRPRRTPVFSIVLQAAIAIGMVLTASFEKLLIYIGFTLALCSVLTVAGMILLRIRLPRAARPYKTIGYPLIPLFFIAGNLWIVFFSIKSKPVASLYGFFTILAGLLVYRYFAHMSKQGAGDSH